MMRLIPQGRPAIHFALGAAMCVYALVGMFALTGQARQARTVTAGVYSAAQASRGQQLFSKECAACHGEAMTGVVGPPLTGEGFLSIWGGRPLSDLVDKIAQTMPVQAPGTISRPQAIDITAYILQVGKFPAGQADLADAALPQVTFPGGKPAATPAPAAAAGGAAIPFGVAGNLAQIMRGVTFPNANIIFQVQLKDPGTEPKVAAASIIPFDYVKWGATIYANWQAVDNAALVLIESTPLFMLPGRRCENGRAAPIDRADYKQFTEALIQVARDVYKAAQTRNQDTVIEQAERLNDACAACHKVYRDTAQEGFSAGAGRCM